MLNCGYGTYLPDETTFTYADFNKEVKLVEAAGFDAIFFAEHQVVSGYFPSALTAATYALGLTTRLRAGTAPTLLPLHHPVRVAESAALTQRMSGGRLILGVGSGYLPADFAKIGLPLEERKERYEEGLRVLQAAWSGKPVEFHGKYYHLVQEALIPSLEARPPIWVAAGTPWGARLAARHGDGLFLSSTTSPEEALDTALRYREACSKLGKKPWITLSRRMWVGERVEADAFIAACESDFRSALQWGQGLMRWAKALGGKGIDTAEIKRRVFAGGAREVADRLRELAGFVGADYLSFKLRWRETKDPAALFRAIERAGEVVTILGRT